MPKRKQKDAGARMYRVLGALVVSMVAGGSLLSWLEPKLEGRRRGDPGESAEDLAESVVAAADSPLRRWRGVEFVAMSGAAEPNRAALAAVAPPSDVHFVVSSAGAVQACPNWLRQNAINEAEYIRVGVPDGQAPESQTALTALINALRPLLEDSDIDGDGHGRRRIDGEGALSALRGVVERGGRRG